MLQTIIFIACWWSWFDARLRITSLLWIQFLRNI